MFRHRESQRQRQAQPDNQLLRRTLMVFRDGRRLTRAKGLTLNLFQERNGDSVGRNFDPGDVHEVGSNVGDIELVNDFLETVQLIADSTWKAPNLSQAPVGHCRTC
jgi:hypothetical protein